MVTFSRKGSSFLCLGNSKGALNIPIGGKYTLEVQTSIIIDFYQHQIPLTEDPLPLFSSKN